VDKIKARAGTIEFKNGLENPANTKNKTIAI